MANLHFISTSPFYNDVLEYIYKLGEKQIHNFFYLDEIKFKSNEIINLLYDGVIFVIPSIFFSLTFLKYFITSMFVALSTSFPKSQYNAASPRFNIFLSMPCYTYK